MAFFQSSKDRELKRMLNAELETIDERYQEALRALPDSHSWRDVDELAIARDQAAIAAYDAHEARLAEWKARVAADDEEG